jgi:hypothetical protein
VCIERSMLFGQVCIERSMLFGQVCIERSMLFGQVCIERSMLHCAFLSMLRYLSHVSHVSLPPAPHSSRPIAAYRFSHYYTLPVMCSSGCAICGLPCRGRKCRFGSKSPSEMKHGRCTHVHST